MSLSGYVEATATKFGIPGVAVGVWAGGREVYACHGVTSLDNPLAVDHKTLFQRGSVTKIYTATALMRLVADGRVDLAAPVRSYVPELALGAEAAITVLHLLNHTSGLGWGIIVDTGEGDDALANYVAKLPDLEQVSAPGIRAEMPPDYAPAAIGLLPGDGDEYIVADSGLKGQRGFFTRDTTGAIVGLDLAGRLFTRVPDGDA